MSVERVSGCRDVWRVETMLLRTPSLMSAYVVPTATNSISDRGRSNCSTRSGTHPTSAFDPDDGTLFAGDAAGTMFGDDVQPVTPPDFDLEDCLETAARLLEREPSRICDGHVGATEDGTAALETFAAALPEWVEAVDAADERRDDGEPLSGQLSDRWTNPTLEADARGVLGYRRNRPIRSGRDGVD